MAMGSVRRLLSLMTVLAQGYSSHAVRKLKMLTEAIAGEASGSAILPYVWSTLAPSIYAASMISLGMFSINPLIMKVEKGITHAT